jgi:prefoldin subunit 5
MEKNELKSYDDLNQPETHSTDVLLSTIEELERTKKQLEIAIEALETIEKKSDKFDDSCGVQEQLDYIKAEAQSVLYNIKELEK